jgi:hypothetical protein
MADRPHSAYCLLHTARGCLRTGQVAKRSNATDCKSVGLGLRRFDSSPAHCVIWQMLSEVAGVTQLVESQPSKLLVAGSSPVSRSERLWMVNPRLASWGKTLVDCGLNIHNCGLFACVAQLVEHFLGKEEVIGSIPIASSKRHHLDIDCERSP